MALSIASVVRPCYRLSYSSHLQPHLSLKHHPLRLNPQSTEPGHIREETILPSGAPGVAGKGDTTPPQHIRPDAMLGNSLVVNLRYRHL